MIRHGGMGFPAGEGLLCLVYRDVVSKTPLDHTSLSLDEQCFLLYDGYMTHGTLSVTAWLLSGPGATLPVIAPTFS